MKRHIIILGGLLTVLAVQAQTNVRGTINANGGWGNVTPWGAEAKLDITTPKLNIKPFFGIKGITPSSSEERISMDYTYTGVMPFSQPAHQGNHFTSEYEGERKGLEVEYGVEMNYALSPNDGLTASVRGSYLGQDVDGSSQYALHDPSQSLLSSVTTHIASPNMKQHTLNVAAGYQHKFQRQGELLNIRYAYALTDGKENREETVTDINNFTTFTASNRLDIHSTTHEHTLQGDWLRPLGKHHALDVGARYQNRLLTSIDMQQLDGVTTLDETYRHRMNVGEVFAEYRYGTKTINAVARMAYQYTRMQNRDLHDAVPMARVQWNINKNNSLALSYAMRIIRPNLELLDSAKIKGAYTESWGNDKLTGIHANAFSLVHTLRCNRLTLATTMTYTHVNDGFNAIWMEREGVRQTFWQNEGKRRAWSLSPDLKWEITDKTLLQARAEVMWDKRIAEAINTSHESWGGKVAGSVQQRFNYGITTRVDCEYSEGYTLDLYSKTGRSIRYGAEVEKSLLRDNRLKVALAYHHCHYPNMIITQGAYTGTLFRRSTNDHQAQLQLSYRIGK